MPPLAGASPLTGVRVVEVAFGTSVVGAGLATSLPGALLRDLGADVIRVQSATRYTLDAGIEFARVWNRGKDLVEVADQDAAPVVRSLAREADVIFLAGAEALIEGRSLGADRLLRDNPRLVGVRLRPSWNSLGAMPDLELLVAARAGLPTQIRAHRAGEPAFPDLAVGQAGAALSATVGAVAGLYEREATGSGRWAETSLYDGMSALLPMIIGRVEHHSPTTRLLWEQQGPAESLCYRCADGEWVQLWFGAKGAYESFLEHIGDPPSEQGYNADLMTGAMVERGQRWSARFATRERDWWLDHLAGFDFRCEPVLRPGQALLDPHVRQIGLAVDLHDANRGQLTVTGPAIGVSETAAPTGPDETSGERLLAGVRVLDLSAYLAGPVAALILGELGADVVKVEPVGGDVHRNMEPMFAAGQRGKRVVALDLKAPEAPAVLARLFQWSDVVHHNSRLGLAERLGYDEDTARAANPGLVYSFASGFGEHGPRAPLPSNDQLIQALAGIEAGQGGAGGSPTFLVWGAVDVTGGWLAACGILAGLYARRRTGRGQRVSSSLLAAGLTLKSGAFVAGEDVVGGPVLDADQLGYGAAYRMYKAGDGAWLALAIPDATAWEQLRETVGVDLQATPPPLRTQGGERQPEEKLLEDALRSKPASEWITALRRVGVPVESVRNLDRTAFAAGFVDDPVNAQLGRIVRHLWGERGEVEQPRFPPRFGPLPSPGIPSRIPALAENTAEVLAEAEFDSAAIDALAASGTIRLPD